MSMFLLLIPILAPVFITAAIGYAWTKWGGAFDSQMIARLITNICAPALIFQTLASAKVGGGQMLMAAGLILACMLAAGAAGYVLLRLVNAPIRSYLPALMLPNMGNIGGPVCYFAFGEEGLAYAVAIMTSGSIAMWTLGAWISSGKLSPRRVLTTPPIVAAVVGAVFLAFHWPLPEWADNSLEVIAAPTFPLMLLALGSSLATMKLSNFPRSLGLGAFRIIAGTAIGIGIAHVFGLQGVLRGVIILQSSMPAAVFNFLFAKMNDQNADEVAGVIVMSTLISALSLPFLVAYVLALQ